MSFVCKNRCLYFGARHKKGRVATLGTLKICRPCDVKIPWLGKNCPCCGCILSVKGQGKYGRTKRALLREMTC